MSSCIHAAHSALPHTPKWWKTLSNLYGTRNARSFRNNVIICWGKHHILKKKKIITILITFNYLKCFSCKLKMAASKNVELYRHFVSFKKNDSLRWIRRFPKWPVIFTKRILQNRQLVLKTTIKWENLVLHSIYKSIGRVFSMDIMGLAIVYTTRSSIKNLLNGFLINFLHNLFMIWEYLLSLALEVCGFICTVDYKNCKLMKIPLRIYFK